MKSVTLKPGKEIPIKYRHHWIFSGAVKSAQGIEEGEIVKVFTFNGDLLGHGYFNSKSIIQVRMLNYNNEDPIESLKNNILRAFTLRTQLFDENTNCYRIINGEGDNLSGLIVDRYNDVLVLQIATVGMDKLKEVLVETLREACVKLNIKIVSIYEKSTMTARFKDGLEYFEGTLWGEEKNDIEVKESGLKFFIDLRNSQKTGLFLDMREMRKLVGVMAKDKKLLNCFSYTGGFSLHAAKGGAKRVDSIDIAEDAVETAKKNFEINGFLDKEGLESNFYAQDAFVFLRENDLSMYDFIILDPPAFAKKKQDVERAKKGYAEINRTTLRQMNKGSYLLTCSCSYHLPREEFEKVVARAAVEAGKNITILQRHRLGMDHPINAFHSEIDYLKSLLLYVY
ncbi:MAG: class I SAM-dependent rRNA methyltransferase [Candidatus Dojkabacteria bacterium]